MAVPAPRRLFTVDEYYRMATAGVFKPGERVELLDGEIVPMNPIGSPHAWCVTRLSSTFIQGSGDRYVVRVQQPIRVHDQCEPEPDLAILRPDAPQTRHPTPAEALLIIEVADRSIRTDRGRKLRIYARARIPEYWIADLNAQRIEVYRQPTTRGYGSITVLESGESVRPLCAPDLEVAVNAVFGREQAAGRPDTGGAAHDAQGS
jgi:Uma2 family endonuclease